MSACALGTSAADLRGFYSPALARAERRFAARHPAAGPAARRAFSAGVAAWIYGLPPLSVRETTRGFPANQIISVGALVDPSVQLVVAPNVDTAYSFGRLDLSGGPVVIDVPDTAGRYYVLQLLDLYSNTIDYIGRRTTGTRPGSARDRPARLPRAAARGSSRASRAPPTRSGCSGGPWCEARPISRRVVPLLRGYTVTPLARWAAGDRRPSVVLPGVSGAAPPSDPIRVCLL